MKYRYIFILLIIAILSHWRWFFNFLILTNSDWLFFFNETQKEFFNLPQLWGNLSLGNVDICIWMYPINILWGILSYFFNFALSERLLYLFPSIIINCLASYFLIKKIIKSEIGAFIGSLIYTYNTYFLIGRTAHLTLMVAFAFAPLIILYFIKTLEEKKIYLAILTGVLSFIAGFYEFRILYIISWIMLFYFIYHSFFINKFSLSNFRKNIIFSSIPIFLIFLLNFYWLLPSLTTNGFFKNEIFQQGLFGNNFMSILYAVMLFHPFWTGNKYIPFVVQPISFYFFLIPLFAFLGFLLKKNNKKLVFFAIISLLGIILTKQANPPFPNLYSWLLKNFPGFSMFREASKFYFLISLGYSILIGAFVSWLWTNFRDSKLKKIITYFLILIIISIFLWNTKPLINGKIETLFKPRSIPKDYLISKDFILKQQQYFRTLWIPTVSRWSPYILNHPRLASDGQTFNNLQLTNQTLDLRSVKYVLIPLEDKVNDDNFFDYLGKRKIFIDQIDKLNYLKKISIGTKEVVIYENKNFRPHIYLTEKKETFYKNIPFQEVSFSSINPTEYKIYLNNLKKPIYLNFSESYHPDWMLKVGKFNWFRTIVDKNYFLPDKNHFKNNINLNSFYLDPKNVCGEKTCPNTKLTLYFKPQSYVYLGGIISLITLIGCISFLILSFIGSKRKK